MQTQTNRINPEKVVEYYVENGFIPRAGMYTHLADTTEAEEVPGCGAGCWAFLNGYERWLGDDDDVRMVGDYLFNNLELPPAYVDGYTLGFDSDTDTDTETWVYLENQSFKPQDQLDQAEYLFRIGHQDGRTTRHLLLQHPEIDVSHMRVQEGELVNA